MHKPEWYRVNALTPVLGHEPGERFEATLDPVQRERLLAGRALVTDAPPAPPKEQHKASTKPDLPE
jgi:hypothetical protein